MSEYFSVFQKGSAPAYRYPCGGRTLEDEVSIARHIGGSDATGKYLYSRKVSRAPLGMARLYRLSMSQTRLRYTALDEEPVAPFDYVNVQGPHQDELLLPVELSAKLDTIGLAVPVTLTAMLRGAQSFKFKDLTKTHVFGLVREAGKLSLAGFKSAMHDSPEFQIPLTLAIE